MRRNRRRSPEIGGAPAFAREISGVEAWTILEMAGGYRGGGGRCNEGIPEKGAVLALPGDSPILRPGRGAAKAPVAAPRQRLLARRITVQDVKSAGFQRRIDRQLM